MTNPSDSQRKPARATRLDKAPVARAPEIPAGEALAAAVDDDDSLSSDDPLGDETVERPRPTPRAQAEGVPLPVVGQGAAQAVHDGDGFDAETTEVKSPFARPLSRPRANPLLDAGLRIRTLTLPDIFQDHDTPEKMYEQAGLDARSIAASAIKALGRGDERALKLIVG